jgi:hypothetical protein
MTVRFSTWIDSLVPAVTTLSATDKIAVVTDAPDTRAITRDDLARAVYSAVMTTDGDLITRSTGNPTRITRSGLADDSAFTNKYTQVSTLTTDGDLYTRAGGSVTRITRTNLANDVAFTGKYLQPSIADAKGDLLVATADNTITRLAVGTNNHALVADSTQTAGVKWAAIGDVTLTGTQTLTNKTLTTPTINGGLSSEVVLRSTEERWNIVASASTGTINFDVLTASVWSYTTDATANWTLNFRGSSGTTLNTALAVGDSITVAFAAKIGATQYRPTSFLIDTGTASAVTVTPLWQGGTAPTTGNANSTDLYVFTIVKTAATPTYVVYASQTRFA